MSQTVPDVRCGFLLAHLPRATSAECKAFVEGGDKPGELDVSCRASSYVDMLRTRRHPSTKVDYVDYDDG